MVADPFENRFQLVDCFPIRAARRMDSNRINQTSNSRLMFSSATLITNASNTPLGIDCFPLVDPFSTRAALESNQSNQ
jgi:hypothetical protein